MAGPLPALAKHTQWELYTQLYQLKCLREEWEESLHETHSQAARDFDQPTVNEAHDLCSDLQLKVQVWALKKGRAD